MSKANKILRHEAGLGWPIYLYQPDVSKHLSSFRLYSLSIPPDSRHDGMNLLAELRVCWPGHRCSPRCRISVPNRRKGLGGPLRLLW